MTRTWKLICCAATISVLACTVCAVFAIFTITMSEASGITSIVNVVALVIVFVALSSCGALMLHDMTSHLTESISETKYTFEVSTLCASQEDVFASEICVICLLPLNDASCDIRSMKCCSNQIHGTCLSEYCSSYFSTYSMYPPCVICRSHAEQSKRDWCVRQF
jgi:hypothetical protein